MARKPDTPCAGCGKMLWGGTTSLPPGQRTCRSCRPGRTRTAQCEHCAVQFTSIRHHRKWTRFCGRTCANDKLRAEQVPPDPERLRAKWRAQNHRRRTQYRADFDRVTPAYERALRAKAKRCPLCTIVMTAEPYLPNSKELDHMVPRNIGGTHTVGNVRIICRLCNLRRPDDGSDYTGPVTLWATA